MFELISSNPPAQGAQASKHFASLFGDNDLEFKSRRRDKRAGRFDGDQTFANEALYSFSKSRAKDGPAGPGLIKQVELLAEAQRFPTSKRFTWLFCAVGLSLVVTFGAFIFMARK